MRERQRGGGSGERKGGEKQESRSLIKSGNCSDEARTVSDAKFIFLHYSSSHFMVMRGWMKRGTGNW